MREDEMVGWQHQLAGHEFEQALGIGEGQGSLACCNPQGHKESDTALQLKKDNDRLQKLTHKTNHHTAKSHSASPPPLLLPQLIGMGMGTKSGQSGPLLQTRSSLNIILWRNDPSLPPLSCCSVAKSCPTLLDPMDCGMPGFPVLHHLPKFAETHLHRVGDTIQTSHLLLSPSPAFNLSQHQGLF